MICLDSHALLWWTLDEDKLSAQATQICRQLAIEPGYASTISIWELGWKIRTRRLDIGMSIEKFVSLVKISAQVKFVPLDEAIWLGSLSLDWSHRDPADRAIVATARELGVPLLTIDGIIHEFMGADAIW